MLRSNLAIIWLEWHELQVLAIVAKSHADAWLAEEERSDEDRAALGSEG
jgi:hypothetical protein